MRIRPSRKPGRITVELRRRDEQLLARGAESDPARKQFQLRKLLVPTDFSPCSRKALEYAVAFASQFQATLTLLHVIPLPYGIEEYSLVNYPFPQEEFQARCLKELEGLGEEAGKEKLLAPPMVKIGQPANEIVAVAKAEEMDLIIISTHGQTGLKHLLMGSTAEKVVRHAPCPVLVVREHEHEFI